MSKRLSAAEHQRRNTFRPGRHAETKPPAPAGLTALEQLPWLDDLPESARSFGWSILKQYEPRDCDSFRRYLVALARADSLPRGRVEHCELLQAANAEAARLLELVRLRQRSIAELEALEAACPGTVWP